QPAWPNDKVAQKRQHRGEFSTKKFFRAIAKVTCSETCDWRVNCDHQCRKPGLLRALDTAQCTVATANKIKLVPDRPSRCGCNVFKPAPPKRRKRTNDPCLARRARGRYFAARKHQPTAPNGREDQRHANRSAKQGCAWIAPWGCDRPAGPECPQFERLTVCAQRRFVLSATVDVVEHD